MKWEKGYNFFQQHNFRVVQLEFDKWRPLSKMIPRNLLQHPTVLHRDTIVYRRGHRNLPARPSKMTGAAIETYRRGHRK